MIYKDNVASHISGSEPKLNAFKCDEDSFVINILFSCEFRCDYFNAFYNTTYLR